MNALEKYTSLNGKDLIEKRNDLNELRPNEMTIQELRFFSIYLSKINARDTATRLVRFPLDEFQEIMGFGRMNIKQLKDTTDSLLCKIVHVPLESGGYKAFQLFMECTVDRDSMGRWFVEIVAHDNALPMLFEFKKKYFTYKLENVLSLKSVNQIRLYELLKQYEQIGKRTFNLTDLKPMLGIKHEQYPRWDNFKKRVIESCRTAFLQKTDICFNYEPIKMRGKVNKVVGVQFCIYANPTYITIEENIQKSEKINKPTQFTGEAYENFAEACDFEFDESKMIVIKHKAEKALNISDDTDTYAEEIFKYIENAYFTLLERAAVIEIKKRYSYFLKILENPTEM